MSVNIVYELPLTQIFQRMEFRHFKVMTCIKKGTYLYIIDSEHSHYSKLVTLWFDLIHIANKVCKQLSILI